MLNEYFKQGKYDEVIKLYQNVNVMDVTAPDEARKVAESYRRSGRLDESVVWMERLIELKPEERYINKLKELYFQITPTGEQWGRLLTLSEGKSKECEAVARYFYEKANGADTERLRKLVQNMLDVVYYEDAVYFEAAELLDKNYYLREITKRTSDEECRKKAEELLKSGKGTETKAVFKQLVQKIERDIPEKVQALFSDMVGMDDIREEIGALYQHLQVNENRIDQIAVPYNFVISGQTGSGKTRLAYIISELLYDTGLSKVREPMEISAVSLLESMEELLEDAPPVIIINNAECLWKAATSEPNGQSTGNENTQTWLLLEQLLEEAVQSNEHFYLFLGESESMDSLISNNAKLKNFVTYLKIPVYTSKQLHQIGLKMMAKDEYEISKEGSEQFYQEIRKKSVLGDFANGHSIQQLIIEAKKNMAYRVVKEGGSRCFEDRDFIMQDKQEESLEELLEQLNSLTGLATVKREVEEKIAVYKQNELNRKAGLEGEDTISLNTLLLGPPGTGKTTVARLLGKIYGAIGILPRGDIFIEVTRDGLVAGYSGQTALKVDEAVKKAMGGVLFLCETLCTTN